MLTRLFINAGGEVACRNLAVTLDVFEAENHLASAVENDFERYALPADWREDAEQSSSVACIREFRHMLEQMQAEALR